MRWEAYERVVARIAPDLTEVPAFVTTAFVADVRAGADAVIAAYDFDRDEAAIVYELASRIPRLWYGYHRRRWRRRREAALGVGLSDR